MTNQPIEMPSNVGNFLEVEKKPNNDDNDDEVSRDQLAKLIAGLLPPDQCSRGLPKIALDALHKQDNLLVQLLIHGLPDRGLAPFQIEFLLTRLAAMDANNNPDGIGVGEREGRIYSDLVRRRNWNFSHGIGRSGNLTEIQPKAPGSALLQRLVTKMAKQMLRVAGLGLPTNSSSGPWSLTVVPMSTGMAISLALRAIIQERPPGAFFVLMPRMDQKSAMKAVYMAGLHVIIIPNRVEDEAIKADINALEEKIIELGAERIAAILTTLSCFAPRLPDPIVKIGVVAQRWNIPHIVNNAYGIQSSRAIGQLNETLQQKTVQLVVQSTDKNFLVPVGGALVVGETHLVQIIEELYPGRAGSGALLDLLITFLAMGRHGYQQLLRERQECFDYFENQLSLLSKKSANLFRVISTTHNDISMAIHLQSSSSSSSIKINLGSFLFIRGVSGARLVEPGKTFKMMTGAVHLDNFGMHHDTYPLTPYLTVASALGQKREEIDDFLALLEKYCTRW